MIIPGYMIILNIWIMFKIGFWETVIGMVVLFSTYYYVIKYYRPSSLHIARIRTLLSPKTISYNSESLRGVNIARAFG